MKTPTIDASKPVIYAEYRLLHALIQNPSLLKDGSISEDLLVHQTPISVYQAIKSLSDASVPISEHSLFQAASEIDLGITPDVVSNIVNFQEGPLENVSDIIGTLTKAVKRLEITKELNEASTALVTADPNIDLDEIQNRLHASIEKLNSLEMSDSDVMTVSEWFDNYLPEFDRRREGRLYPFNDIVMDEIIQKGAQPGDIGLIASSSGQGKSTYCLNLINKFINTDIPSMYFTLEMGQVDTMDRLISMRTETPFSAIVNPETAEFSSIRDQILKEKKELETHAQFRICESPTLSINDIVARIKKFKQEAGVDYCVVVIDLLTQVQDFCKMGSGSHNMAQIMELAINRLSAAAKENHFHVIGVVQFNRNSDSTKVLTLDDIDKLRPNRNDIKNANALLERARYVLYLFRPKFYADMYLPEAEETKSMQDIVELGVLKMSNGSIGRKTLLFQPEIFTMTAMQDETPEGAV